MFAFSSIKHALFVFHLPEISCPSVFLGDHLFSVKWTALPLLYLVHPLSQITNLFLARIAPVCPCKQCPAFLIISTISNKQKLASKTKWSLDSLVPYVFSHHLSPISYRTANSKICHHVLLLIVNFIHFQLYIARCIPEHFGPVWLLFSFCFALDHFICSSYRC